MKITLLLSILCTLTLITTSQELFMASSSNIKFTSDAPLELIEAESTSLQGILKLSDRSFVFRLPMKSFNGFNSALQKTHFNTNYLETSKYEHTIFEGKIIEDVDLSKSGVYNVRGKGRFTCHGIEQERIIKCKVNVKASSINITSEFSVLLDDHDIKIPSVMNQKIAEDIVVLLEIELKPK